MIDEPILKKKDKKKRLLNSQLFMIMLTLLILSGVTYAFFEFNKASEQDLLGIAGNIYMELSNETFDDNRKMYPMTSTRGMQEGIKYNFTIKGYNDSVNAIYYGIYLNKGSDIEGKIRLRDSDIMMVLYEIKNGEKRKVYGPGSVEEFVDTLIYANSIPGNMTSNEEISIDYELIFWVSEKVLITNSTRFEGRSVYTQEEYANSYANIRVNVAGDFEVMATANDEVTISAKKKSDNVTYITNLSYEETPYVNDDVIVNFTMNKEPNKLVITDELTNNRNEYVPIKNGDIWTYQKEENKSGKYTYYVEYSDGFQSDIYHYNVRIDKEDPSFTMETGKTVKVNSNGEISITNKITNISSDIKTLKYALIKRGEVIERYQNIPNFKNGYEIEEELKNGVYELHVLAIDEAGKEHTDYVTYYAVNEVPIIYQINDIINTINVIEGESINYLSTLPTKSIGMTKFTKNNEGMQEVTNETVVTDDLKAIYVNYTDTVSKLIHEHNGNNGLVAISKEYGMYAGENDTFREYRYSGNGRYCTYTNDGKTYTLNVESYESTCPKACLTTGDYGYIIHKTSDYITIGDGDCSTELTANESIPIQGPVKNYIRYNNELWRIIGVFEETTGSGTKKELVKIIKDTPIAKDTLSGGTYTYNGKSMTLRKTSVNSKYGYFYWNVDKYFEQTNANDWTKAGLQYYLNDESGASSYYNSIISSDRSKIETVVYSLGNGYWEHKASDIYNDERGTVVCDSSVTSESYNYNCNIWNGNSAKWTGKIGLMYGSDYGYAADKSNWNNGVWIYFQLTNTGSQQNWLRDESNWVEWTMSPSPYSPEFADSLYSSGDISDGNVAIYRAAAPVLYLKSDTKIVSGTGLYNDPYTLS